MRILLVNPNSTSSMTAKAEAAARRVARPDTEIVPVTIADNPPSIQGFYDIAMSLPGLLGEIEKRGPEVDAVVIACFDDTGPMLRAPRSTCPHRLCEARFHAASFFCCRFSVVTHPWAFPVPDIRQISSDTAGGALPRQGSEVRSSARRAIPKSRRSPTYVPANDGRWRQAIRARCAAIPS